MRIVLVALAVAVAVSGCSTTSTSDRSSSAGQPRGVTSLRSEHGRPPARTDLLGTWKPVILLGRDVRRRPSIHGGVTVGFHRGPGPGWTGYDGCNWTSGPFRLARTGAFTAVPRTTTLRGCYPRRAWRSWTANVTVMTRADRVSLAAGRLTAYSASGRRLGVYVRAT